MEVGLTDSVETNYGGQLVRSREVEEDGEEEVDALNEIR